MMSEVFVFDTIVTQSKVFFLTFSHCDLGLLFVVGILLLRTNGFNTPKSYNPSAFQEKSNGKRMTYLSLSPSLKLKLFPFNFIAKTSTFYCWRLQNTSKIMFLFTLLVTEKKSPPTIFHSVHIWRDLSFKWRNTTCTTISNSNYHYLSGKNEMIVSHW